MSDMPINEEGLKLIKECEGFRAKAYQDQGGVWTIGYGETGPHVREGVEVTEPLAANWLRGRLKMLREELLKVVHTPLTENEIAGLLSLIYNIGFGAFLHSKILRLINEKHLLEAGNQFLVWNKVAGVYNPGLFERRLKERELFFKI